MSVGQTEKVMCVCVCVCVCIHTHTHTHTHIYIKISQIAWHYLIKRPHASLKLFNHTQHYTMKQTSLAFNGPLITGPKE